MNIPADQGRLTSEGASGSGLGPVEQPDLSTGGAAGGTGGVVPVAQPGRGVENVAYASEDAETISRDGTGDLRADLAELINDSRDGADLYRWNFLDAADAVLAAGWRPPLPKADLRTWRSLLAGIIDGHFGDDYREQAEAAAEEIIDRGWLDKVAGVGPPEPVATTLRRIIRDLEDQAAGPQRHTHAGIALSQYADRLRGHPALDAEADAGWSPLPEAESARWQVTVQVPAAVPVEQRQELFSRVAEVAHDWEPDDRDGWDVDVSGHPGEYLWVENQRLRTLIGDLDRKIAASSPLPDSETEWQWAIRAAGEADGPEEFGTEGWARAMAARNAAYVAVSRTAPGPWIEVTS